MATSLSRRSAFSPHRRAWAVTLLLLLLSLSALIHSQAASSNEWSADLQSVRAVGSSPWDLSGAQILSAALLPSASTRTSLDSLEYRVEWSAPPPIRSSSAAASSTQPASPPLLYSLFAESRSRRSVRRVCRVRAGSSTAVGPESLSPRNASSTTKESTVALSCLVHLPHGEDQWTLHVLAECETEATQQQRSEPAWADHEPRLSRCHSSISLGFVVTTPAHAASIHPPVILPFVADHASAAAQAAQSFAAAPGVHAIANDTQVRTALCRFYNATSGPQWTHSTGWCNASVPVCMSYGVQCDASGQWITDLLLSSNNLVSLPQAPLDGLSFLFEWMPLLATLDFSTNYELLFSLLDLSSLTRLSSLKLYGLASVDGTAVPIRFPPQSDCSLTLVDASASTFDLSSMYQCSQLVSLAISSIAVTFPFSLIASFPALTTFSAHAAILTGEPAGVYAGLSGIVTNLVLSRLNETNPALRSLDVSSSTLPFGSSNVTDTWPQIVSPSLQTLLLSSLTTLRTGLNGPTASQWLRDLPALETLGVASLPHVHLLLSAFATAGPLLSSITADQTDWRGDLGDLCHLRALGLLSLEFASLNSELPSNISACWPVLADLSVLSSLLVGALPDFRALPNLRLLALDGNELSGPIGVEFAMDSPHMSYLSLTRNRLVGPTPSLCNFRALAQLDLSHNLLTSFPELACTGLLSQLLLQGNAIDSVVPSNFWQSVPQAREIDLSFTLIHGPFPDRPVGLAAMTSFSVSNTRLSGPLPRHINAVQLDFSFANFSGPVVLSTDAFQGPWIVTALNLASAGSLACPIALSNFTALRYLTLSNASFAQCAFDDPTMVQLPASITQIDISDSQWEPMTLQIEPSWLILRANRANVLQIASSSVCTLTLLSLDGNDLASLMMPSPSFTVLPLKWLLSSPTLQSLSCIGCSISGPLQNVLDFTYVASSVVQVIRLDKNSIAGQFEPELLSVGLVILPPSLVELSLSNNPIQGRLPNVPPNVYSQLQTIDVSDTAVRGSIPASWSSFTALHQLNISSTGISCELVVDSTDRLQCADQTVLFQSQTTGVQSLSLGDPSGGVHCAAPVVAATGSVAVNADPSYHAHTWCTCDANSFGLNALCYLCPEGCTCAQDRIQNCFPVVRRGSIAVNPASNSPTYRFVVDGSVVPFTVSAILPCPRTVIGAPMCNPGGLAWPSFYRISETAGLGSSLADLGPPSSSDSEIDLSGWCYPGHTGRLCAACSSGYFSSGRWCLKCLSESVHVVILIANLLVIIALIAYLYTKSPSAATSAKGLRLYVSRLARSGSMESSEAAQPMHALRAASDSASSVPSSTEGGDAARAVNPLKLMIFHSQQLSLLLQTSASIPPVFAGLLSVISSGSTGFSLSSLVAMECLTGWSLSARCWMAVAAPAIIGLVAGCTALVRRMGGSDSRPNRAFQLQGRDEPLLAVDSESAPASSSVVPRIYSVCVSLLYFLVFPCAQTVLSAVACTDTREAGRSYLNLYPDQSCDAEWRRTVLPPALIGLLFWVVAFPLGSTLMLLRLRARVAASSAGESASVSSSAPASASASALSVWPICSDLLLPYSSRFWYWDQLLLLRRLLLVSAVTLIPASSLYLPLVLFAIIQLSALQQHWAQPYAHSLLNAGELASLYLLLLNYISALILQTGLLAGGFQSRANAWAIVLFVLNVGFLLILLAGFFSWVRKVASSRVAKVQAWFKRHA